MTETLVQWFVQNLGGSAAKELIIFIISMIPILELRGGLLAAGPGLSERAHVARDPHLQHRQSDSGAVYSAFYYEDFYLAEGYEASEALCGKDGKPGHEQKGSDREIRVLGPAAVRRYPASGTGAWTGSLIAALLGIKFKKAFPAVCLGILLASFIMTVLSYTVIGGIFA